MYHMTVFDHDGTKLYDEPIDATDDETAKAKGLAWLTEHNYDDRPYRIFSTKGKLVAFQSHEVQRG